MPTTTYTPIASVTLSASASEVVFSGLPQTFRDLVLITNGTDTATNTQGVTVRFNGDSANYSNVYTLNNTSGTGTTATINATDPGLRNISVTQIMDYSATDKHKTLLSRGGSGSTWVLMSAARWASTSAITTISVQNNAANFSAGTTFNLFGVIA